MLEYLRRNKALLVVEDDAAEGFKELSHAFALFADSAKQANPEQRGRFNLGEKLVLAAMRADSYEGARPHFCRTGRARPKNLCAESEQAVCSRSCWRSAMSIRPQSD